MINLMGESLPADESYGWICDTCHEPITDPSRALITWSTDDGMRAHSFLFVHKGKRCDVDRSGSSWQLSDALGPDGHSWWMHFLTKGPGILEPAPGVVDLDEFVDALRRAQVPGYEQARPYFQTEAVQEAYGDANEVAWYEPRALADIAHIGARTS